MGNKMKTYIAKLINIGALAAVLGAGVLLFSAYEESIRPWVPFFILPSSEAPPLDLPVDAAVVQADTMQAGYRAGIPVLMYHGIIEKMDPKDDANTSVQVFESQIKMLKEEGYTSIDTTDLYAFIQGKGGLPRKPIIITFDDGRIDSVRNGDPILRKYGFRAVLFVATGKQNHRDKFFLSWDDLRNIRRSGRWDIQTHSGDHYHTVIPIDQSGRTGYFASNKKWLSGENRLETDEEYGRRLSDDAKQGRSDLERHLPGIELVAFAFPFGDYGVDAINIDQDLALRKNHEAIDGLFPISFGFDGTYTDNFNFFYFKGDDSHLIKRLDVRDALPAAKLKGMLDIYLNKSLPFRLDRFDESSAKHMLPVWNAPSVEGGSLRLSATAASTGAQTVLTGTNYWTDYKLASDLVLESGRTGFVVGRYADGGSAVLCGVDQGEVSFRQTVAGKDSLLGSAPLAIAAEPAYHIELDIYGDRATCSVNGIAVGPARIDPALAFGGAGFKAWDPEKGRSSLLVRNLKVTESALGR
jgi:peptidoglycan/xylan/chitin deacetylase (PgdA/CDA1 family)